MRLREMEVRLRDGTTSFVSKLGFGGDEH
jgi:hypothetical protein